MGLAASIAPISPDATRKVAVASGAGVRKFLLVEDGAVVAQLRLLIHAVETGGEEFRLAAEQTSRTDYRMLFAFYARQHAAFAGALRDLAATYGADLSDMKTSVPLLPSDGGERTLLAECRREEARAVGAYRDVLDAGLPRALSVPIAAQSLEIKGALNHLRHLVARP